MDIVCVCVCVCGSVCMCLWVVSGMVWAYGYIGSVCGMVCVVGGGCLVCVGDVGGVGTLVCIFVRVGVLVVWVYG